MCSTCQKTHCFPLGIFLLWSLIWSGELALFLAGEEFRNVTIKKNMSKRNLEELTIYWCIIISILSLNSPSATSWEIFFTCATISGLPRQSSYLEFNDVIEHNFSGVKFHRIYHFLTHPGGEDYSRPRSLRIILRIVYQHREENSMLAQIYKLSFNAKRSYFYYILTVTFNRERHNNETDTAFFSQTLSYLPLTENLGNSLLYLFSRGENEAQRF